MLNTILGILVLVMALFLVVTILLQSSKDHRMSGTIAGGAETFFGKQKGKSMDGLLNKLTIIICVVFFICVLVMYIAQPEAVTMTQEEYDALMEQINAQVEAEGETDNVVEDNAAVVEGETEADVETEAEVEAEAEVETEAEAEVETETTEETTEE